VATRPAEIAAEAARPLLFPEGGREPAAAGSSRYSRESRTTSGSALCEPLVAPVTSQRRGRKILD
jgi:hypothetical protein